MSLRIFILTLLLVASSAAVASTNPPSILGPNSAYIGSQTTYFYDDGLVYLDPTWYASKGTVISSTAIGTSYSVTIEWTSTGTATIQFAFDVDILVASRSVTINPISTPNTTYTTQNNCGNSVVTRNANPPIGIHWYWQTSASGTSTTLGNASSITVTTSGNVYLRARTADPPYAWSASSQNAGNITITTNPAPPATANPTHHITNGSVTANLSVSAVSGATSYKWFRDPSNQDLISGVTTTSYSPTVSASTTYYVEAIKTAGSLNCASVPRKAVTANIYPLALISTTDGSVNMGSSAVLSVSNFSYDTYQWISVHPTTLVETNISGATSATYTTNQTGIFKVRVSKASAVYTTGSVTVGRSASGQTMNYVVSNTIQRAGVLNESDVDTLNVKSNTQVIQYFDDLGRPLQTVTTQGSPSKKDIVQPFVYDGFGREYRKYLPVVPNTTSGWYKAGIIDGTGNYTGLAANFYNNNPNGKIAQDPKPYSETIFETSPLNRPLKSYEVGSAWAVADKYVGSEYPVNVHGTGSSATEEKVIAWEVNGSNMPVRKAAVSNFIETNGYYSKGQLTIKKTINEEGNAVREYTNKEGQMILKKVQAVASSTNLNSATDWALTYYIYDKVGNLRFVLPPELSKLAHSTDSYVVSATELNNWGFQYTYDARKRMATKRVPGAGEVYLVYDKRDRLVLTQDANQRTGATNAIKYWSFTKYDAYNRPIMTGIKDTTTAVQLTQAQMQDAVDTYYDPTKTWRKYGETYVGNAVGNVHGYTNTSYPKFTSPGVLDVNRYLTVTYYDTYDFRSLWTGSYTYVDENLTGTHQGITYNQPDAEFVRVKDKVTGTKVKVLDGGLAGGVTWLKSVSYFDEEYQAIQSITDNYKGGTDRTTNVYDFSGKVLKTKTTHSESDVAWKEMVGVKQEGNKLIAVSGPPQWGFGAASVQQLGAGQNGWFEIVVSELTSKVIGFNDSNSGGTSNADINYAFQLYNGTLYIQENTSLKATVTGLVPGDVLRMERVGTTISFKRNGVAISTSAITASSSALFIDNSFHLSGNTLVGVRSSFSTTIHTTTRRFEYDHGGRLLKTWHTFDSEPEILLVKNEYNELGQLVDKKLHSTVASGANARQSVDYSYNIRGWLTKLNESDLSGSGEPRDLFGMQLAYNDDIGVSSTALYNGNISAIKCSNNLALGTIKENAYNYSYDAMNRISTSAYKEKTASWTAAVNNGNAETGFTYDLNGNIKTLQRNDKRASGWMDNLTYTYSHATEGASNKLRKVADSGDDYKGFIDGSDVTDEYTYDANGNMITDLNKGLSAAITYNFLNLPELITRGNNIVNYVYDASGKKLAQITNFGGVLKQTDYTGEYQYENDALQHVSHKEGRIVIAKTETVFTHSADVTTGMTASNATLAAVTQNGTEKYVRATSNGTVARTGIFPIGNAIAVTAGQTYRIRAKGYRTGANSVHLLIKANGADLNWPGAALANGATAESWTEQTVTIPTGVTTLEAGVVWNTVTSGQQFFLNEFEIIKLSTNATPEYQYNLKDHLGNVRLTFTTKLESETAIATLETANAAVEQSKFIYYDEAVKINTPLFDRTYNGTTGATYYSTRLVGGSTNAKYGLAKSLSVMPGDTLNIEVYAKYLDTNSSNWSTALNNLMTSIANGTAPAGTFIDGGAAGSTGTQTFPFIGTLQRSNDNGTGPKGYLNYILFNRDFVYQTGGFVRVTTAAKEAGTDVAHERLAFDNLVITEPGYIYIYLSNENETNVEIYFDDFKVQHKKSPVVQSDDYYAFGLTFNSYSRENTLINPYKYNGKILVDNLDLRWYDYHARQYDPQLGRFLSIDPATELMRRFSTYTYSFDNPIRFTDPDGMLPAEYQSSDINRADMSTEEIQSNINAHKDIMKQMHEWAHSFKSTPAPSLGTGRVNFEGQENDDNNENEESENPDNVEALKSEAKKLMDAGYQKDAAALFSLVKILTPGNTITAKDISSALSDTFKSENTETVKQLSKITSISNVDGTITIKSTGRIALGSGKQWLLIDNGAEMEVTQSAGVITIESADDIMGAESATATLKTAGLKSATLDKTGKAILDLGFLGGEKTLLLKDLFK